MKILDYFKNSPNNNSFFSIPYYKILSENKDFTLTPRLYAKDQLLIQTEFREAKKDGNNIADASILFDENYKTQGHLFYNSKKEKINEQALKYINRLSDLFFVLSRVENDNGKKDILWKPGKNV